MSKGPSADSVRSAEYISTSRSLSAPPPLSWSVRHPHLATVLLFLSIAGAIEVLSLIYHLTP